MDGDATDARKRFARAFFPVLSFVLTLFLFTPVEIYIGNFKEFSFLFHESALFFLAVSLILLGVLSVGIFALSRRQKAFPIAVSIVSTAAFLMWLQGNILLWKYGVLNGRDIDWGALVRYGIIDSILWTALISLAVLKADVVFRISRFASVVLIAVQLVSVSMAWISMPKDQEFKLQESDADTMFLFSDHLNVIVMILDTFQSDIFQDIIRRDAELRASFDGFTYFRNSLAGSDATTTSVPNILTGAQYDNSVPYLDFVRKSFRENSLIKTLREYGFGIDLYPILKYSVYDDFSGLELSVKRLWDWQAFFKEQALLADLSMFRAFPHFLKKAVYNNQRWFVSGLLERLRETRSAGPTPEDSGSYNLKYSREYESSKELIRRNWDVTFIHNMIPASGIAAKRDSFKFFHLNGVHLQLMMNENLEYDPQIVSRAAIMRQGTGVLKIAAIFLERLKQLGAYENSLIFIVGDHGSGMSVASINPSPLGRNLNKSGPYRGFFHNFKTAGIPLILVKRIGSFGELETSDAPVCLGDIPQTVADELGLEAKFPGRSMFSVKEGEERERIYRAFFGPQEDVEYLAPLQEYCVNGFSWDDSSWRETGNMYYPKDK